MRFVADLLILSFLLLTNSRVLFVKREKKDVLVMLSPLSLFLSVLLIFAWGVDFISLYLVFLSILVILSNFHALFRYSENLYVDHYSGLMMFWAFLTIMLSIFGIVVTILFFPGHLSSKKLNVEETKYYYEGNLRNGFSEKTLFGKTNIIITEYVKSEEEQDNTEIVTNEEQNVILFVPDKRGDTEAYRQYLQTLASKGNIVFSADFFTEDMKYLDIPGENRFTRQFLFILYQLIEGNDSFLQRDKIAYNVTQEVESMISILENDFEINGPVFIISDKMTAPAVNMYKKENPQKISGCYNLLFASAYETPGYGFITFNNPLVAKILGYSANRDKKQFEDTVAETLKAMIK